MTEERNSSASSTSIPLIRIAPQRLGSCVLGGCLAMAMALAPCRTLAQRPELAAPAASPLLPVARATPCLPSGKAYLRARIRGAVTLDVDLHGRRLACEGGPRLDGGGVRVSFEGRVKPGGRRLRMVFGIAGVKAGRPGRELPTNLTVIFEGERLLFATQGDGNCTVDRLSQERLDAAGGRSRSYRITAHGFCIAPANDLSGRRRILVTRFDFAGRADFGEGSNAGRAAPGRDPRAAATPPPGPLG